MTKQPTDAQIHDAISAVAGLLRRVIEEASYHEESGACNSCDRDLVAPHKANCIIAEAAQIMMIIDPKMSREIRFWPSWDDSPSEVPHG